MTADDGLASLGSGAGDDDADDAGRGTGRASVHALERVYETWHKLRWARGVSGGRDDATQRGT